MLTFISFSRGWLGGAKALGKLPVPGCPTNLDYCRARTYHVTSDLGLQCVLTGFSIKYRIKATPLKRKWTRPTYNSGRVY